MADNLFSDLNRMIDQVGKDKGIDKQIVVDAVVQGMLVAARKKYGSYRDIEALYNDDVGEVELIEFKEVVTEEDFVDELVEITLPQAQELDSEAQVGDSLGIALDTKELGRIAAQTARQIIIQKVRDAERDVIHAEFSQREGEIASGIARRVERGAIVVDLGRTEAFLPYREQIPGEQYKSGDRIQGYLAEVRQTTRGPQIIMSRADERYLMKLFEIEVPEIYDGIVDIVAAAREPGHRAKIAVRSSDPSVDPVGACVGMKGSRVQNIVSELKGEKIDIVVYDDDITRFACNALAPAEISKVFMDEVSRVMEVVVPDTQLSLAIGKKGQNVRLAAKLTGWKLDIVSESQATSKAADAVFNLKLIPGISDTLATSLFQHGYGSFGAISETPANELSGIPGFDEDSAVQLVADAKTLAEKYADGVEEVPVRPEDDITEAALPPSDVPSMGGLAKDQAEQQLKEAFAQFDQKNAEAKEDEALESAAPTDEAATEEDTVSKGDA